ncbi:YezD family protein [Mariprofundus ferrooxydans]|uniref:YezD family protein n=1 Tax=Mariprofundus ferrooxydans TaxID=314344 RepID=UPI0003769166|nr:YezD family protein [Mariprofundus ferrooxydans]
MHGKQRHEKKTDTMEKLQELLTGMRYGTLELTVHDGRVVQIERRERVRINA